MLKCILQNGIKRKLCLKKQPGHWLDQEKERYPTQLVEDTKTLLKILVLFIPFPIYFALFMQQVLPCPSTGPKIVWLVKTCIKSADRKNRSSPKLENHFDYIFPLFFLLIH